MTVKKIWGSRVQSTGSTFIAEDGMLFYDEADGELRLGDGVTPGGLPVAVRADLITTNSLIPGSDNNSLYGLGDETHRWYDAHIGDGGIFFNGYASRPQLVPFTPGAQVDDIVPALDNDINLGATDKRFANMYLGYQGLFLADETTDQNINITVDSGTLYIDGAENLRLGNLAIRDTTLTSANNTLDISIGDAGDTGFFYVKRKAQIDNTTFGPTQAMLGINASGGVEPATIFPDTLIQTVSRPNKNSRIAQRSYGSSGEVGGDNSYAVWASYSARGNVTHPAALKANDILSRVSSNGFGTTTWGSGGTRIESVAEENFTDTAKGSRINFWTTPTGSIVSQLVASVNSIGLVANGIQFSTDSTVQTTAGIPLTQKGVATGVATLGIDGRLTTEQIPSSLSGAITFQGGWNAATNTPTLSNGTGVTGYQYIVTTPGNRDLGAGNVAYASGDTITYGANVWNYVQGTSPISSVSGNLHMQVGPTTGAVVIGINATPNATASTVVSRDSSGNFQANTITATLAGQATSAVTAATVTAGTQTAITAVGTLTSLAVAGNVTTGNVSGTTVTGTVGQFTNINTSLQTITANLGAYQTYANTALGSLATGANANTAAYLTTATGNISAGNVTATNYTGKVTQSIRNAGVVTGTTLTLNVTTDDIVKCTFTDAFTVAFSNIIAGRTITLIATNTSGADTDIITAGISAVNMQGDSTLTVSPQSTAVITYYSLDGDVANIYASAVYA
jgi:hypothetical protein